MFIDIGIHWGVLKHLRKSIKAKTWIIVKAVLHDLDYSGAPFMDQGIERHIGCNRGGSINDTHFYAREMVFKMYGNT